MKPRYSSLVKIIVWEVLEYYESYTCGDLVITAIVEYEQWWDTVYLFEVDALIQLPWSPPQKK